MYFLQLWGAWGDRLMDEIEDIADQLPTEEVWVQFFVKPNLIGSDN